MCLKCAIIKDKTIINGQRISTDISLKKTCKRPKAHGRMLHSIGHQENANQTTRALEWVQCRRWVIASAVDENAEKLENSYTAGETVK